MTKEVRRGGSPEPSIRTEQTARAMRVNRAIHKYVMAIDHALLWVAALSFAAYFHLSSHFNHSEALLLSTLVAYGAYLFESIIATIKEAAAASWSRLNFRKAGLWGWIALNICVATVLSLLFLNDPSWPLLIAIILTAGWQKYMDGRIPPRLEATRHPWDEEMIKYKEEKSQKQNN